jgi:glutamyl/glutaminyl-tRNA synthetase
VFNPEKLDWFNQQHIARLAPGELTVRLKPLLEAAQLWSDSYVGERHAWFFSVLELLKPRAHRLDDFVTQGRFFFAESVEYDDASVEKHLQAHGMAEHLLAVERAFMALATFDALSVETALRTVAEVRGVKAAPLIHAVRVAITGKSVSPGLFEVLALLGRERAHARLQKAVKLISSARA